MSTWPPKAFKNSPDFEAAEELARRSLDEEIREIKHSAYQEAFFRGMQDGLSEGQKEGERLGRESGYKEGLEAGRAEGEQRAYSEHSAQVSNLVTSLNNLIELLSSIQVDIKSSLAEIIYETALRLSDANDLTYSRVVSAVEELLQRLPQPGDQIFLRVSSKDLQVWNRFVDERDMPFSLGVTADPQLQSGNAWLEVMGARIDIGRNARQAIVKSILGLSTVS